MQIGTLDPTVTPGGSSINGLAGDSDRLRGKGQREHSTDVSTLYRFRREVRPPLQLVHRPRQRGYRDFRRREEARSARRQPTLESLQHAKPHIIRKFLYGHNVRRPERIQELLDQIKEARPLTTDRAVVESCQLKVQSLIALLRALVPSIAVYDAKLDELFSQHSDAPIFQSLPGAGPALAPRLLAAYGTDRTRFPDARSMQTFCGIAPITVGSGTVKDRGKSRTGKKQRKIRVQRRYACPKFLRQSFHEFAEQSILRSAWARAFYRMLRARGMSYHAAVRTLAFKWIRIINRLWHAREAYDEAKYLDSLWRRNSSLVAYLGDPPAPVRGA